MKFIITKREWRDSFMKWQGVVKALSEGDIASARRKFHLGCGYCTAFQHTVGLHATWDELDRCTGCPLSRRRICINDPEEYRGRSRPYWLLNEDFNHTAGRKLSAEEKAKRLPKMLELAEKIFNAIRKDEGIAVERRE